MAERRMFAKSIIDSDAFLDMPLSSQALYLHLSMRADDDGFINNPKRIQRMIGCADDDLKLLIAKSFIIPFDSGVVVIKHWRINNYIQKDRYTPTNYVDEKAQLQVKENGSYTQCIQNGYNLDTQVSIGKVSIGKVRLDNNNACTHEAIPAPTSTSKRFIIPTLDEVQSYCKERHNNINAQHFIDFYASKGWKVGNQPMKDWKACVRTWENQRILADKTHTSNFKERDYSKEELDRIFCRNIEDYDI